MNAVYELIQENPQYFAWGFGVVNVLWIVFTYFNKQSHDKRLEELKQDLRLEADRRLKVFELKASEYKSYVANLDAFGKKYQTDLPARMQPMLNEFLENYLAASGAQDKEAECQVITRFSSNISALLNESVEDVLKLKSESNRLKLTATDEMLKTFSLIESSTQESMDTASELMGKFTELVLNNRQDEIAAYQKRLSELGNQTQMASQKLMEQMRAELKEI